MANSDEATGVRHVRCPRCHSVLQEPTGVPVYQCGGCGTSLRAKTGSAAGQISRQDVPNSSSAPPSTSRSSRRFLGSPGDVARSTSIPAPPDARSGEQKPGDLVSATKHGSGDVATSTSSTTHDVTTSTTSRRQATADTISRLEEPGDLVSASKRVSEAATEKKEHGQQSTSRRGGAYDKSEFPSHRDTVDAERNAISPGVNFGRGAKDQEAPSELQQVDSEWRRKDQLAELPDAARKKRSGEAAARDRPEVAPKSAQAAGSQPSRDAPAATSTCTATKAPSPPRHEVRAEDLAPLRQKILKAVDELKGDLSELFSKSPDLNQATRARPPRVPKQKGYASHVAAVDVNHHGSAPRPVKPGRRHQVAAAALPPPPPRGLPSRRYRRCRADYPCRENVPLGRTCHHGCCRRRHHGKPTECSSCRGHCCGSRPTTRAYHQEPSAAPRKKPAAPAKEAKRPRQHCLPVLKGAPFIICSSCFMLVQVPADFAVSTNNRLPKLLRCGSCSAVLSYSYRDPAARKKFLQDESIDHQSSGAFYGSEEVHGGKGGYDAQPEDPFVDGFGLSGSYSTEEDEQQHASRNTSSFDTVDGVKQGVVGRLHRLMGYGSASELLLRHRSSPDLCESQSLDERTTPDAYDRKGKGVVCVDAEDDDSDDDEDSGVLKLKRGAAVWPGMLGMGFPGAGSAIRINSQRNLRF